MPAVPDPKPDAGCHCWNCGNTLSNVKKEGDGTVVGTCWHCGHDGGSAIENDEG